MVFFNTKKKISLDGVRTNDLPITGQTPYPLELREHLGLLVDKLVIYLCNNYNASLDIKNVLFLPEVGLHFQAATKFFYSDILSWCNKTRI